MDMDINSCHQSDDLDDITYNYFKIPADLQKAELHGLAYRVYELPRVQSVQCKCCNYYKDHIKFRLCSDDLSYSDDHVVANDYFQTVKWMILQLTILCVIFVPFALYFNQQGDNCEKHPNCDVNSLKIYSIWNLIDQNFSLGSFKYVSLALSTSIIFIIFLKYGSFDMIAAKGQKSVSLLLAAKEGIYIPNKIENEYILNILDAISDISSQIYIVNLKLYEDLLFEKLKFSYLRDKTQQKKIILREVFEGNEDIKQTFKQSYLIFLYDGDEESDDIKEDFMTLCKENFQKYYYKYQMGSPYFQYYRDVLIAIGFTLISSMAQFVILKLRYDFINNNYSGEEDQMIKQLLNVGFTLVSMIVYSIFYKISSKILSKLASSVYQICGSCEIVIVSSLDFTQWNFFQVYALQPLGQRMLQNEGMIDYLITFSFLNLIVPIITQIFDFNHFWKKIKLFRLKWKKTNNKTQREANILFQLRKFNFYERQRIIYKIFAVSMLFGFQFPVIIPFSILSLLLIYWVDKYIYINYSIPAIKDRYEELLQGIYIFANLGIVYYFFTMFFLVFKLWICIILVLTLQLIIHDRIIKSMFRYDINVQEIVNEFVEQYYQISNDEKYQLFINLQKRLKKFAKKQKKNRVFEAASLLE